MAYAEKHGLAFIETSALDASGVDDAFRQILTGAHLFHILHIASIVTEIYARNLSPDESQDDRSRGGGRRCSEIANSGTRQKASTTSGSAATATEKI